MIVQFRNRRDALVWLTRLEAAQLRRLVYRAYALRGKPGYEEALEAIETWQVETAPERLDRHTQAVPVTSPRRPAVLRLGRAGLREETK